MVEVVGAQGRRSRRWLGLILGVIAVPFTSHAHAAAETRPMCFPVLDPVTYTDSFGAPRSGHTHEGNDLMGAKMHRLLSATDGVIVDLRYTGNGTNADNGVRIRGDDGWYHVYLHMNNDRPGSDDGLATFDQVFAPDLAVGARVRAGQFLGYMGDSGNAEGTNPHLHYELRRPAPTVWQAVAISPYDSLRAARRCSPHGPANPYIDLGGVAASSPDSTSVGTNRLDVVVRGTDDQLWQRSWDGRGFTPWTQLGGVLRSGPAVTAMDGGRLVTFVRGSDDQLWFRVRTGSLWGEWLPLDGVLRSDPDVASNRRGDLTVVVRGTDDAIWQRTYADGSWGPWTTLGGRTTGGPTVAAIGDGRLAVYVRGSDDALWGRTGAAGSWGAWRTLGGTLVGDPDATGEGGIGHVVVRGTDDRVWHLDDFLSPVWAAVGTERVGGDPTVTSWGPSRLDVFVPSSSGGLLQTWSDSAGW